MNDQFCLYRSSVLFRLKSIFCNSILFFALFIEFLSPTPHIFFSHDISMLSVKYSQVEVLGKKLISSMSRTEDFLEIIEILECNLIQEKKRVLTLAALCEPIRNLSSMLGTYGQVSSKYCIFVLLLSLLLLLTYFHLFFRCNTFRGNVIAL